MFTGTKVSRFALLKRPREQLRQNIQLGQYFLEVELEHLIAFSDDLGQEAVSRPGVIVPLVLIYFEHSS